MKHPVLRIKKDSTVYDDYETDRETRRLTKPSLDRLRTARRPRSRKRRVGASAVSLLVLAVGVLLVMRQVADVPRAAFEGWQVILRATPHDELIIVGVTFIAAPDRPDTAASTAAPEASIRVTMAGTDIRMDLAGALDRSPMTLRGELPWSAKARKVQAAVSIGSVTRTLRVAVPRAERR